MKADLYISGVPMRIELWKESEYNRPAAFGFMPDLHAYLHEDAVSRPCVIVLPGGCYRYCSPAEGELPALKFYRMGYQAFVLTYTTNPLLNAPLYDQPMRDLDRAVRLLRAGAQQYRIRPDRIVVLGFSAGGHNAASLCCHWRDMEDPDPALQSFSGRPDAAVLAYPVITFGRYSHRESVTALIGGEEGRPQSRFADPAYFSLENQVTRDVPPTFLWQTQTDDSVPVENSFLYASALRRAGIPFACHIFSSGTHGLSLADEDWGNGRIGGYYTYQQIEKLLEALRGGVMPALTGNRREEAIALLQAELDKDRTHNQMRINPEVMAWPALADDFLRTVFKDDPKNRNA